MAANESLTTLSNVLKTKYENRLEIMAVEDDPFLAMIKKDTNFGGSGNRISLRYGSPQGGSITYATARSNRTGSSDAAFTLTRAKDYHVCGMDAEALFAGKGEEHTVINAMDGAMEGGMKMIKRSLEVGVYGDGVGTRAKINATVTGTTLTITDPTQIVNFEVGMKIQFVEPATPALRDSGEAVTISTIDRDAGSMVVTPSLTTIASLAENDLIIREGDFNAHIKGLAAWLPLTAPGATAFFGQDRSTDPVRLGGVRWAATGDPKVETLMKANIRLSREGGKDKRIALVNIEDYGDMVVGLGAKAIMEPQKDSTGKFGFESVKLPTPRGFLPVMGSLNVPQGEFYILQPDTWVLKSLKKCPHIVEDDGLSVRRDDTTADAVFWVLRYYAQLGCYAPGYNLHGQF